MSEFLIPLALVISGYGLGRALALKDCYRILRMARDLHEQIQHDIDSLKRRVK